MNEWDLFVHEEFIICQFVIERFDRARTFLLKHTLRNRLRSLPIAAENAILFYSWALNGMAF